MPSLFLYADNPLWRPRQTDVLLARLKTLGLLGSRLEFDGADSYLAGHDFLQLLMFLGCSPQVTLAPGQDADGQPMCFVRLFSFDEPVLLLAWPMPAIRCAQCRASVGLPASFGFETRCRCSKCGATANVADLDWRQGAGCGSLFVEIHGIYPQEAVPSEKLLHELSLFSGCDWNYFFADSPRRAGRNAFLQPDPDQPGPGSRRPR